MSHESPTHLGQRASGLAVASLCLAVVSGFFFVVVSVAAVGILSAIIAVVLGFIGISNISHDARLRGKGIAWSGIGVAAVFLVITFIFWLQIMAERT